MLQFIQDICWRMWSQCTLLFCMLDQDTSVLQCLIRCPHIKMESFQNTTSTTTRSSIDTHSISATETVCRCGRGHNNKDRKRHNCSPNKRYASRCPHLKKENSCQPNCNCINCNKPVWTESESFTTVF